jgi:AcrR family transcriptional regulator
MPPKAQFTREDIIEAAFNIAAAEGLDAISARKVAAVLGCSVAPIYVNFDTIDALTEAVVQRIQSLSAQILAGTEGRDLFEKIGRASLAFARDYPVLFRDLVLRPNPHLEPFEKVHESMADALGADKQMGRLSFEERRRLFLKMQIFQTGLQAMIANGLSPSWLATEEAEELLMETGQELLEARLKKHNKQEDQ